MTSYFVYLIKHAVKTSLDCIQSISATYFHVFLFYSLNIGFIMLLKVSICAAILRKALGNTKLKKMQIKIHTQIKININVPLFLSICWRMN